MQQLYGTERDQKQYYTRNISSCALVNIPKAFMCREINYLVVKFELNFPLEGYLSVLSMNWSTPEMRPVLPKLIMFTNGV